MQTTITATEAASTAHVSIRTIRTWCRNGQLAAVKSHGRWAIRYSVLAELLCPATDRPRAGQVSRQLPARGSRRLEARRTARATSREYRIPLIGHHQRARIALTNSGHVLARDYLFSLDLDVEFIEEYESAFGRAVAKAYRAAHNAEPDTRGLVILHGRLWHCARYTDIRDLHAGARRYARTADLFGLVA